MLPILRKYNGQYFGTIIIAEMRIFVPLRQFMIMIVPYVRQE